MFTGLVETIGTIADIRKVQENIQFIIHEPALSSQLRVDESVSHNGICLTVESINGPHFQVTAIQETLQKTTARSWQKGQSLNLERAMLLSDRLGGHLVQGHVDGVGVCTSRKDQQGSVLFTFNFPDKFAALVIEKGSITIDGISLTCFDVGTNNFSVSVIPYTLAHTTIQHVHPGMEVNVEFDLLGKYIQRHIDLTKK